MRHNWAVHCVEATAYRMRCVTAEHSVPHPSTSWLESRGIYLSGFYHVVLTHMPVNTGAAQLSSPTVLQSTAVAAAMAVAAGAVVVVAVAGVMTVSTVAALAVAVVQ